jgi:hypothetical protein
LFETNIVISLLSKSKIAQKMNTTINPPKRSIKLSKEEKKALKNFCKTFQTEVDCALSIGIDRNVLSRVRMLGSGSEHTISKIRESLGKQQN